MTRKLPCKSPNHIACAKSPVRRNSRWPIATVQRGIRIASFLPLAILGGQFGFSQQANHTDSTSDEWQTRSVTLSRSIALPATGTPTKSSTNWPASANSPGSHPSVSLPGVPVAKLGLPIDATASPSQALKRPQSNPANTSTQSQQPNPGNLATGNPYNSRSSSFAQMTTRSSATLGSGQLPASPWENEQTQQPYEHQAVMQPMRGTTGSGDNYSRSTEQLAQSRKFINQPVSHTQPAWDGQSNQGLSSESSDPYVSASQVSGDPRMGGTVANYQRLPDRGVELPGNGYSDSQVQVGLDRPVPSDNQFVSNSNRVPGSSDSRSNSNAYSQGLPDRQASGGRQFIEQPAAYRRSQNNNVHPSSSVERPADPNYPNGQSGSNSFPREAKGHDGSERNIPVRKAQQQSESKELAVHSPSNDPYSTKAAYQTTTGGYIGNAAMGNQTIPSQVASHQRDVDNSRQRSITARRVSAEILGPSRSSFVDAPGPIENPTGWNSVGQELRDHLTSCDDLLRRSAVLSAREEVLKGLRTLYRTLDLRNGSWYSEPGLDQALAAFDEEADFHQSRRDPSRSSNSELIVEAHATQALKKTDLKNVSPELAAQHYRAYAKQQLIEASQGHPWAADMLYALGKTYDRQAEKSVDDSVMLRNQAVVCYQAALSVAPRHADGANQLGYALLKLDRVDEAHIAITRSIQIQPGSEAWNNLAEVYRRKGDANSEAYAINQATAIKSQMPGAEQKSVPEVVQLDPQTFASISPSNYAMPSAQIAAVPRPVNPQSPVQPASAVEPKSKASSWFGKMFK